MRRILIYALLTALALVFLFPFYWLLISAFKAKEQIFVLPPEFWPNPWRVENFVDVFRKTHIVRAFFNSTFIAAGHCTLALFLCSLAGYAFAKFPHAPGRDKLFAFVLATMMIPGAVTLIPVFVVLCKVHAINTYWAMIVPGAASAFGIFWMRQYTIDNVHNDLLDAARIDGCGEFAIYWRVVLPILKPALGALGIVLLIGVWNNLMWAFIVLRTESMYTLPLVIYLLNGENRTPFELIMAASLVATVPLVVAFLAFQRQFIQGITAGAIKG
ncbi:MAG TPA: carbohydrate ABC transporter permease [Candidatus Hydrogenedentes bacterium]|nr:carbohydrate ABC transporter permease [Candidatus Hydrogenedentota bacterium]HOV75935.1 carbohydrate ABC transporter permease [Candidatus Hydrogenedentota bacterium]HPC17932.1 carbohydrate ABC transporter permease [Candidatus Hydrogenedentota bacterium]HRT19205.1 carbohydrate ABC transporter permease [Candidatus Hydrogenedentota bacterium]HRT66414.1 carbohydrate ABC transporter permease [Candidatus Hydrogenedentota bacterium]